MAGTVVITGSSGGRSGSQLTPRWLRRCVLPVTELFHAAAGSAPYPSGLRSWRDDPDPDAGRTAHHHPHGPQAPRSDPRGPHEPRAGVPRDRVAGAERVEPPG